MRSLELDVKITRYMYTLWKKITTYRIGNQGPNLGHAHRYGGIKPVIGIPNPPLLITGS